ncbi:HupE/UreJ family protein [Pseudoxanthobacter sp. M-2]|uniref:HupE/UreJ family protein n=1 Tax=Pseudoxanthobacter sp. M-2 TaxID=3078754 RepID=UPI0038FC5760
MKTRLSLTAGLAGALALTPGLALAHTGVGDAHGFVHGFMHPVGGLDHVLAMVAVGIFAWQLGGRALWAVPVTFVAVMAAGGLLGVAGIALPFVELAIALSVVVLGAAVAIGLRAPLGVAMGLAGFFALFHGYAHGAEMPVDASGLAYGAGFMLATALLHLAGLVAGMLIGRLADTRGSVVVRVAGGAMSVAGLAIVAGTL